MRELDLSTRILREYHDSNHHYKNVEMDNNLSERKFNGSTHESNRMTHLNGSQSPTSAPMILKNYTTSISPPTHYLWPAIVANSQVSMNTSHSPLSDSSSHSTVVSLKNKKRKANPIPAESKDEAYWERRKRNNESAKRSREVRRVKEQQTNSRVMFLEQENIKLRTEVETLREEIGKLREMLYNGRPNRRDNNDN